MGCTDVLPQLSGCGLISSSRSLIGVLKSADFLKGAFRVCVAVTPCDTKQQKNYVEP